jgi:hypothetical protein
VVIAPLARQASGWPQWVDQDDFTVKNGLDPLGLETITIDRIVPRLVPGILALSDRARYFSFHLFLLDEFARRRLEPTSVNQSYYFRRREYEFGAAVLLCERCGSQAGPVGSLTLRPVMRRTGAHLERGYSVESHLGGYGLYYRTPLRELGLVAPRGTPADGTPIPVDLITPRGRPIAEAFRRAIQDTDYYRYHFVGEEPIALAVLRNLARVACLCRLTESAEETRLIRDAFFEEWDGVEAEAVRRRRQAFGLLLRLAETSPEVLLDVSRHREATWEVLPQAVTETSTWADTVQRWAALYGKEYYQEGLRVLWRGVNQLGRRECPADGMSPAKFLTLVRDQLSTADLRLPSARLSLRATMPTSEVIDRIEQVAGAMSLEALRAWCLDSEHALAGVVLLLALGRRVDVAGGLGVDSGWYEVSREGGNSQLGLFGFVTHLKRHLAEEPSLADTVAWLVRRFVIAAHDRIAASKLPEFTFRFRLEGGRLHFYSRPTLEFGIADSRHSALGRLGRDMGLWEQPNDVPVVTAAGRSLIMAAFA